MIIKCGYVPDISADSVKKSKEWNLLCENVEKEIGDNKYFKRERSTLYLIIRYLLEITEIGVGFRARDDLKCHIIADIDDLGKLYNRHCKKSVVWNKIFILISIYQKTRTTTATLHKDRFPYSMEYDACESNYYDDIIFIIGLLRNICNSIPDAFRSNESRNRRSSSRNLRKRLVFTQNKLNDLVRASGYEKSEAWQRNV